VPPYQVAAIGPEDLFQRLSDREAWDAFVRARAEAFGIRISFAELDDVRVAAYAGIVNLRYARPAPSPAASPVASGSPTGEPSTGSARVRATP
jgi:hypothetical protein